MLDVTSESCRRHDLVPKGAPRTYRLSRRQIFIAVPEDSPLEPRVHQIDGWGHAQGPKFTSRVSPASPQEYVLKFKHKTLLTLARLDCMKSGLEIPPHTASRCYEKTKSGGSLQCL